MLRKAKMAQEIAYCTQWTEARFAAQHLHYNALHVQHKQPTPPTLTAVRSPPNERLVFSFQNKC